MAQKIRVTVWNEFRHEKKPGHPAAEVYPEGMHKTIADFLEAQGDMEVRTATLDQPEHGLTEAVLAETDVLTWWGHCAHGEVADEIVDRVQKRVLNGMGLICLHSAHFSKIFKRLMGTSCDLKWREAGERELLWVTRPGHEIVQGIDDYIDLPHTEMYGEYFDIPEPDETVFLSSFAGGEVFRSGITYRRGAGKIFYFRPGHETYPIFKNPQVQKVIVNGVRWAAPVPSAQATFGNRKMGWTQA